MSASLVGSEMCIRDRFTLSANMATTTSPELVWGSFWMAFQAERDGGDYPVSYTHLTLPTICSV
eukprot:1608726-Alexandrium_andersonii.AAC.1